MAEEALRDRFRGALLGTFTGDALGRDSACAAADDLCEAWRRRHAR